jgi:hypothetical protein
MRDEFPKIIASVLAGQASLDAMCQQRSCINLHARGHINHWELKPEFARRK